MEALVPCTVGVLLGCCLACALADDATAAPALDPRASMRGLAIAVGRAVARAVSMVDEGLSGRLAAASHRLLACSGVSLPAGEDEAAIGMLVLVACAGALGGGLLSAAWPGVVLGAALPVAVLAVRAARERRSARAKLERLMPEAFGALAVSIGTGYSLAQAMRYVGCHMEDPVGSEFTRVGYEIEFGAPPASALDAMIERLSTPGIELVAIALKVSKRTGAPPGGLLAEAARTAGERIELGRMLDVKTAQARMSARVVALMPLVMMGFLLAFSNDYREGVATVPGMVSVAAAVALDVFAWRIIGRIMRIRV